MLTIFLGQHHVLITESEPDEFDIEHVFHACNRIDTPGQDMLGLYDLAGDRTSARWLVELRGGLETVQAPSMSVGDYVFWTAHSGAELGYWECEPAGWDRQTVEGDSDLRRDMLNGRHILHVGHPVPFL